MSRLGGAPADLWGNYDGQRSSPQHSAQSSHRMLQEQQDAEFARQLLLDQLDTNAVLPPPPTVSPTSLQHMDVPALQQALRNFGLEGARIGSSRPVLEGLLRNQLLSHGVHSPPASPLAEASDLHVLPGSTADLRPPHGFPGANFDTNRPRADLSMSTWTGAPAGEPEYPDAAPIDEPGYQQPEYHDAEEGPADALSSAEMRVRAGLQRQRDAVLQQQSADEEMARQLQREADADMMQRDEAMAQQEATSRRVPLSVDDHAVGRSWGGDGWSSSISCTAQPCSHTPPSVHGY